MTIQEAINKALEGGYPIERIADLSVPEQAQCFLETTFWEALGRALDVRFISSLPVMQGNAYKAWVDRKPVQMVRAGD